MPAMGQCPPLESTALVGTTCSPTYPHPRRKRGVRLVEVLDHRAARAAQDPHWGSGSDSASWGGLKGINGVDVYSSEARAPRQWPGSGACRGLLRRPLPKTTTLPSVIGRTLSRSAGAPNHISRR